GGSVFRRQSAPGSKPYQTSVGAAGRQSAVKPAHSKDRLAATPHKGDFHGKKSGHDILVFEGEEIVATADLRKQGLRYGCSQPKNCMGKETSNEGFCRGSNPDAGDYPW